MIICIRRQKGRDDKNKLYVQLSSANERGPTIASSAVPMTTTRKIVRLVVVHATGNRMENVLALCIGDQATAQPEDWASQSEWVWVQSLRGEQGYYPKEWMRVQ